MNILLIDDEKQLTDAVSTILKRHKYNIEVANDGELGLDLALYGSFDVILLDIMLPKIDGLEILRQIRQNHVNTSVLLLSAKSETEDKIKGLNIGADDYLTKPFDIDELIARINALMRRQATYFEESLSFGNVVLDKNTYSLVANEKSIQLGSKEYQIMELLMRNHNAILSKDMINDKVWGYDNDLEYNNIEVYISFLRKKLLALNSDICIKAYRGTGYRVEKND